jgi:tetratricopeptide (TPR) repeat protein
MRIAVLLDPSADPLPVEALAARPGARMVLLPGAERLAQSLARAIHAYGADADGVLAVQPVGEGVIDAETWRDKLSALASVDEDDALIEARITEASRALDEGRLGDAREAYAYCDALLSDESGPRHAEVLACLGHIADAEGDFDEAIRKLDLALALFPTHRDALEMRRDLARRMGHPAAAAAMAKRLLAFADGDDQRVGLLMQAAEDGLRVAVDMLNAALRIRPRDPLLLDRLRAVHEASADWPKAVDVAVSAAEQLRDPQARARAFVAAAEMSASRARNVPRAVALYEAAITDDPEVPGAFEAIEKVLLDAGDHAGAQAAYVRQLERLTAFGTRSGGRPAAEAALLEKLARVRETNLDDPRGAIEALDRLAVLRPEDVETRAHLARLLERTGQDALAIQCLEVAAHAAPSRMDTFRALYRIFHRIGDVDRAYSACSVLVNMGEADLDEQLVYQQFAPDVSVRALQPLGDGAWAVLIPTDVALAASALFGAIAPAALAVRLEQMRVKKQLPRLDPAERQDVEGTTVSAVRTVGWVSKLFGIPVPDVYIGAHEVPGGIAVLPAHEASVALSPTILSGRSPGELAFMFARELVHLHLTSRLLAFYPTLDELRALATAAVGAGLRDKAQLTPDVGRAARELALRVDSVRGAKLSEALQAVTEDGGQIDLVAWLRAMERAACRAGLLACGDLAVAARVLSVDRHVVAGMSAAERLRDLVPFSVSADYSGLRRELGIAARSSRVG